MFSEAASLAGHSANFRRCGVEKSFKNDFYKSEEERRLFNSVQKITISSCQAAVGAQALEFTVQECNHLTCSRCQEGKGGEANLGRDSATDLPRENPNLQSYPSRTWLHRYSLHSPSPGQSESNNNKGIKVEKFGLKLIRLAKEKRGYSPPPPHPPTTTPKGLIMNGAWI